jgi:hypothetical protein
LDLIGDLYAIERSVPDPDRLSGDERCSALALRKKVRDEQSRPLVDKIDRWAKRQSALPESKLRKAIAYMIGLWPGLVRFLDDPLVPLHNNLAERELRRVVVGRKIITGPNPSAALRSPPSFTACSSLPTSAASSPSPISPRLPAAPSACPARSRSLTICADHRSPRPSAMRDDQSRYLGR